MFDINRTATFIFSFPPMNFRCATHKNIFNVPCRIICCAWLQFTLPLRSLYNHCEKQNLLKLSIVCCFKTNRKFSFTFIYFITFNTFWLKKVFYYICWRHDIWRLKSHCDKYFLCGDKTISYTTFLLFFPQDWHTFINWVFPLLTHMTVFSIELIFYQWAATHGYDSRVKYFCIEGFKNHFHWFYFSWSLLFTFFNQRSIITIYPFFNLVKKKICLRTF
jgi:hypothetical protein